MKHITQINGSLTYELEPESDDDKMIIGLMKNKGKVTMKPSSKGGIIFELDKLSSGSNAVRHEDAQ